MAKPKKPTDRRVDSHSPFAALASMRATLPKRAAPRPAAKVAVQAQHPAPGPETSSASTAAAPDGYSHEDRVAFSQAVAGVKPLKGRGLRRRPATPAAEPATPDARADAAARTRLDALVGGGVHFELHRETDRVEALRQGVHPSHLTALLDSDVTPDLELDLHGLSGPDAKQRLSRFVRDAQGRGARTLLIIHGRGRGSRGAPVLGEAALDALMHGGAAPLVCALATAPRRLGGEGALLVRLGRR